MFGVNLLSKENVGRQETYVLGPPFFRFRLLFCSHSLSQCTLVPG